MTGVADALVVFGITGDLARTKTLPALYDLTEQGVLTCPVIGVGRRPLRSEEMQEHARAAIEAAKAAKGATLDRRILDAFLSRLSYVGGDAQDDELYEPLRSALKGSKLPVFYLAIPPASFLDTSEHLAHTGLFENARLVVEKPFGTDLLSARELNRRLTALVPEERLYRIDHFLGKEPVQDILYLRFTNALFEPVWSREQVDSIQVTMAEDFGVDGRGAFYDGVGALRDVVQNHLLQVLALVTMEPPSGDDDAVSRHRLDVFRSMPAIDPAHVVRGQYRGYEKVDGVQSGSDTETFVALRFVIENWRWAGVPVFVRAGKALPVTATEIVVRLQQVPELRYGSHRLASPGFDDIVFRIGRDAGVTIDLFAKAPGKEETRGVSLDVSFVEELGTSPGPYERLLTDALRGDTTLFPRWDVIEETWRIVQPLLDAPPPVEKYRPGTWGPRRVANLPRRHGGWREPQ
jgi:glucose-6-phosphate 1-dehydrogenase